MSSETSHGLEARELVKKAEKKCQPGLLSFLSGGADYDEACRLYSLAANKFRLDKSWPEAADCILRCAAMQEKTGDKNQQANYYSEAAVLFKKYSTKDALEYYNKAVDLYAAGGRFNIAGKLMKGCGEVCEEEGDREGAVRHYKRAADYFDMEEHGKSQYSHCIVKYAELKMLLGGNLSEGIQVFEHEGEKALRNELIQFGAKEHFLKAGILYLAKGDTVDCKLALGRYGNIDPRFSRSREGKLYEALVTALEQQDVEAYTAAIHEYNTISPLDVWKIHFLHKAKESLPGVAHTSTTSHVAEGAETSADIDLT